MEILHRHIPYDVTPRALPGVSPVTGGWLQVDEAYAGQMARRRALLDGQRDDVHYIEAAARPAARELLDMVLALLPGLGFDVSGAEVACPDGALVPLDRADPLGTLGRLVQCDFVLLDKRDAEHVLTGAVLCFPASWRLNEKAGRPLEAIHAPVTEYDDDIARRVQRMFDAIRVGQPLWRYNVLWYHDPELHQPRTLHERRAKPENGEGYLRSERQTMLRLPISGTVVFAIHTYVLAAKAA